MHGGVPGTVRPLCPRSDWRAWAGPRRALSLRVWNRRGTLTPCSGARGAGAQTERRGGAGPGGLLGGKGPTGRLLFQSFSTMEDGLQNRPTVPTSTADRRRQSARPPGR